ncbi:hypothetical protein ACFWFF_09480 [Streptomyces sp. NPDC060223]|uniref:hypothetical protein n=1 Tax=unclassified Streptomyces TaxID=2593676 RepID=UPI00362DAD3F
MRRIRELVGALGTLGALRALGALAMAVAVVLLSAPLAAAGGPTSVLVVSPESEETAALYYSDEEYGELQRLLGDPASGSREEPPGLGVGDGRQINVTWLAHDVSPWRVDRVYPDTAGGGEVWIHTANEVPQSTNGYWHKAAQPDEVRALFKSLGVLGESSGAGSGAIYPAPWQEEDAAAPASGSTGQSVATATATQGDGTDWWWAIPGAAAGAALALVLRPLVPEVRHRLSPARRRAEREPGPRQELIDL